MHVMQVIFGDPVNYPPTVNTARVLAEQGATVTCVGFHRGSGATAPLPAGARYHYLNEPPGGWPRATTARFLEMARFRAKTVSLARRLGPDLIIAYDAWGLWAVQPLLRSGNAAPVVFHIHDNPLDRPLPPLSRERFVLSAARRSINACRLVVYPEPARHAHLTTRWTVRAPVAFVANCPQLRRGRRNAVLKDRIEARDGVRPSYLAVSVGTMGLYGETLRALSMVDPRWHLAIVGCGNRAEEDRMRTEARSHGVEGRLHIFPYTPYDTVAEWLRGCDLGLALYPSGSDNPNWRNMGTGSVKLMEYMGAGIPSLVCRSPAFDRLGAETGALIFAEAETAEAIAAAFTRTAPDSEAWRAVAAAAGAAHRSTYNYESQLAPVLGLLGIAARPAVAIAEAADA